MLLLSRDGLRQRDRVSAAGAQTERRGVAGPERNLPGGETSSANLDWSAYSAPFAQDLRQM
jgi:hypothetical protein